MTSTRIGLLEIEKIYGGYLLFIISPNDNIRCFIGKFTKKELKEMIKCLDKFLTK